jgi:hypothetical protein
VRPFGSGSLVRGHVRQSEHNVDAAEHQHAILDLDLPVGHGGELPSACDDLARLQRAA